ncbi:hypothetical protein MMC25_007394 [Agyrium rufum]|nr:hypothetical protein [Agyrium rufum]
MAKPLQSPFRSSTFRQLRRQLRSPLKRPLFIGLIAFLFLLITVQGSRQWGADPGWATPGLFSCPSNRTNFLPQPTWTKQHQSKVKQTWSTLKAIFDEHGPVPSELPKPKHKGDGDFPSKEKLKHFINTTEDEVHRSRIEHETVLRHIPPYPERLFSGKGVVMLAGGRYSEFAATSLGMLREVGSRLPVEVWMKDESENFEGWCDELEREGMLCRKLSDCMDLTNLPVGYQWKIFTMLFSAFEEIIFLDADSMPMWNPDYLFESKIYQESRAILWPDYWKHTGSPWLPYVINISDGQSEMLQDERSVESGQIVWDKHMHWKPLCLAAYYNYHGPKYYYTLINQGWAGWGDKDTFPIALKAFREPYYQVPHDIITMFVDGTLLGIGMVQGDPTNTTANYPLFMHSNIVKWSVREFFCKTCPPRQKGGNTYNSLAENPDSYIYRHLREGKRIFNTNQIKDTGLDPEPVMWKSMEHTACRSVWGTKEICRKTREHMRRTFGTRFQSSWLATFFGYGDRVCIVNP